MTGFHDDRYTMGERLTALENKLDRLTVDDLFKPIVSLSTTDRVVADLLVGDRVMTGFFDSTAGCWMVNGGKTRIPEGMYPSHWRKLST